VSIFNSKMIVLYFACGLAFFTMALVIAFQVRKNSSFVLAKPIWMLAGFGLFQACAEWVKVTKLLNMYGIDLLSITALHLADVLTIGISFLFLFLFGVHLVVDSLKKHPYLKFVPLFIGLGWTAKFIVLDFILFPGDSFKIWAARSTAWARYLMAFPGAVLVSTGLLLQLPELRKLDLKSAYYNCQGAAFAFAAYGFFSGLVTFPVDFWPGSVLNTESFWRSTGLPVQIFRASFGLLMAFTVIKTVNIFNVEQQKRLEEAERLRVLMAERDRFSRDLHDGIIQSIYGAGLIIDASQAMLDKGEWEKACGHLADAKTKLNQTIAQLRDYIRDLQKGHETRGHLKQILQRLIHEFHKFSMIPIDFVDKLAMDPVLSPEQGKHVYHLIQEALFNVVKHARATRAGIIVEEGQNQEIRVQVSDNGTGFDLEQWQAAGSEAHKGLVNMMFRAQQIGGRLAIETNIGQGTKITLAFRADGRQG